MCQAKTIDLSPAKDRCMDLLPVFPVSWKCRTGNEPSRDGAEVESSDEFFASKLLLIFQNGWSSILVMTSVMSK